MDVDAELNASLGDTPSQRSMSPFCTSIAQRTALDDPAVVDSDGWIDQIAAQRAQPRERAILVSAGEPAVADHIGDQDRSDFAGLGT